MPMNRRQKSKLFLARAADALPNSIVPSAIDLPRVAFHADGYTACLTEDMHATVDNTHYCVPARFKTDFASVPRLFWRIVAPLGPHLPAAILHDWLYYSNGMTRAKADMVLFVAMGLTNTNTVVRYLVYWAVRLGGWHAWNAHRERDRKERMRRTIEEYKRLSTKPNKDKGAY
jgi:hypothetical protein